MYSRWPLLIGIFILIIQACGVKPEPEDQCNFVLNSVDQRVSWNGRTPVVLYIHESVPKKYRKVVDIAMEKWRYALGTQLFKLGGVVNTGGPAQDGSSVIYWRKSWDVDRQEEQGRTTIYWTGTQIFEADVSINNRDFEFFWSDEPEPNKVDVESLLVHELGHVLGLSHSAIKGSVMVSSLPKGVVSSARRNPDKADLDSLKCEY